MLEIAESPSAQFEQAESRPLQGRTVGNRGVKKGGVEISVEDGNLFLVGHRRALNVSGDPIYLERRPVHYRRVYELDPSIDTDKITARVEDGILTVTLPKSEKVKPKKITLE